MVRTGRGQAAVDWTGLVVAVALVLGALALWAAHAVRPPAGPPDALARVTRALGARVDSPRSLATPPLGFWGSPAARDRGGALSRLLAGARGRLAQAARLVWVLDRAATPAMRHGAALALARAARDPVGWLLDAPDLSVLTPQGAGARGRELARGALEYWRLLRGLPADEAARRLGHDLGQASGEAVIDGGRSALRRALLRRALGRQPGGTAPAAGGRPGR